MKNRGFTLIELIATIALLGVLALISFVSITKVIENSKDRECASLVKSIETATKEYVSDNRYSGVFDSLEVTMTAESLIYTAAHPQSYLSSPITNPYDKTQEIDPNSIEISIILNSDYTVSNVEISNATLTCIGQ